MISFKYTILYVSDVEATLSFYERAFDLARRFITPEGDYGELVTGEATLCFAAHELANKNLAAGFQAGSTQGQPFGFEIGFVTTDVEKTLEQALQSGATLVENPRTKPWGQIVAYVRDIDGFLIEICTSIA